MGACPNGAVPKSDAPPTGWVWVGLAGYLGSKLPEWLRLVPWLAGAGLNQLVNIPNLCALNPDPPEPITPLDLVSGLVPQLAGPLVGDRFFQKVWDNLVYDAFQQWCVCNATAGSCSADIDLVLGQNLEYNTHFPGFGWPTTKPGSNSDADWNYDYYKWDLACGNPIVQFWQLPDTGLQVAHSPVRVNDCNGIIYSQSWTEHNPFQFTVRSGGSGPNCPGFHLAWAYNVNPQSFPNWHVRIGPATGPPPPTRPPDPPPDQTAPVPTPPPMVCDSNTLCAITWNILNQTNISIRQTDNQTTTLVSANPTSYVAGASYTVSGSGVQVVAQGTLGVAVQLVAVPPSLVPTQTNPPRYYDLGYLQLGAGDALDGKRWIHSSGDRFIPVFPEMDRVHYNLTGGVTVTITELLPPPPS